MNHLDLTTMLARPPQPVRADPRLYIVAGDKRQAISAAERAGLFRRQWVYVGGEEALRGKQRGITSWHVGTWAGRRDIDTIQAMLSYLQAVEWDQNQFRREVEDGQSEDCY